MKSRIMALILVVCMCFTALFTGQIVSASKMRGDLNTDGVVDVKDLLIIRKYCANLVDLSADLQTQADCDNDGKVKLADVNAMINYLLKRGDLYKEAANTWYTLHDWESYELDAGPKEFKLENAVTGVTTVSNDKNTFSQKAVVLKSNGLSYKSGTSGGSNPTAGDYPSTITISQTNTSTEIADATNLRVLMNYVPKADELSVLYIGFTFKGSLDKYYHRITLENYSEYNYFYFAGKEFTKMGERRTYLEDEVVETITLTNDQVKKIRTVCIWFESNKGNAGAPLIIDDIDYYEGDATLDGSAADDANLPQPDELVNDGKNKYIAISFDDGPQVYSPTGKHYMEYYMDVAKDYDAKFSFFVIGNNCGDDARDVEVLKRAVEEGHAIENHTTDHTNLFELYQNTGDLTQLVKKITELDDWLRKNVGVETKYLRPPFIGISSNVYAAAKNAGMKACICGPCPQDYNQPSTDYETLYYEKNLCDGIISLNHEHFIDNVETIRRLLEHFTALGYKFVTIDELFELKGVDPTCDKTYCMQSGSGYATIMD